MQLGNAGKLRSDGRDHRALERPGGHHHLVGLDQAHGGLHRKARATFVAFDLEHFDTGTNGRVDLLGIGLEVGRHLILAGEGVGIQAFEFQAREAVVPGRAVGHQRVPATGAPGFGDAVAFQHQVLHPEAAQVLTHGHAGLTGAYYKRINSGFFNGHGCALLHEGVARILCAAGY